MIEAHRGPVGRDVAVLAGVRSLQVRGSFTRRNRPVVTGEAGTRYIGMIKAHRAPIGGNMAVLAGV